MASDDLISFKAAREVLGVGPFASAGDLRRAFREAAKAAHPDRPGGDDEAFRRVVAAYHRLQPLPALSERIIQPPAKRTEPSAVLKIDPLIALNGGWAEHDLAGDRRIRVRLPPGLRAGDTVRAGETQLNVAIEGATDALVRGDDLWLSVSVAPQTLAQGGRIALDTPLGRRIVWVTRKAGERGLVRIVGQGLPARGRHRQGDLFLRLAPTTTGQADSAARTLLRQFTAAWAA